MLLSAEHVSINFGARSLLTDVNFYLEPGDRVGVIGINGTGKSTFLRVLSGQIEPDEGSVTRDPNVQVSFLSQNPEMREDATILEQVFLSFPPEFRELNEYEAKSMLTKLGLTEFERKVGTLSGGQRKRLALAAALIHPADVLILDEPTNHLDTAMVTWLEDWLRRFRGGLIMVTHDRYFLERVVNHITELSRGKLYHYEANYSKYLELKAERAEMAEASERKRQSILRTEREWDARWVLRHFSYGVLRDDRIGIVGHNGVGKSTLLRLIAGELQPDEGSVDIGTTVRIGHFSQEGRELDLNQRVYDFIHEIGDEVKTEEGTLTAKAMMERFLFPADLQSQPIGKLSGGERRRLYLLSILMAAPNVLLLDEPTNDLDVTTLSILEDYLQTFPGPILAVSHDRFFLDKLAGQIFEVKDGGTIERYVGNWTDWEGKRKAEAAPAPQKAEKAEQNRPRERKLKFSFKEQREFETIEGDIAELEQQIADCEAAQSACGSDYVKLQELTERQTALEAALEEKMDRWVYLTDLKERIDAQ